MQLDPTFLSNYTQMAISNPSCYVDGVFGCRNIECPTCLNVLENGACSITVEMRKFGFDSGAAIFEQTYVAPVLRESHPELFT